MSRSPIRPAFTTLFLILSCLLVFSSAVPASRARAVSPDALPEGMRDLVIEDEYTPSPFPIVGTIHSLRGTVVVVHRADQKAFFGSEGDPIHENDEFYTLADSRCRLRFINEDVISLGADTQFSVDTYVSQEETGEKTSIFSMARGKAMFYAMRLFKYRQARFQVKTPTAVMGVRGTQFGAHVYWLEEQTADTRGVQVADSGGSMGPFLLAQAGGDGTPVTEVGVGDGDVQVNGVILGPGQYYNSFTGEIKYDPTWLAGLAGDTDGDNGENGEGEGEEGNGDDLGDDDGDLGDMDDAASNITSTQSGSGAAGDPSPDNGHVQLIPSGYFAAILSQASDGYYLGDIFLSKAPNEDAPGLELRADSLLFSDPYLIFKDGRYIRVVIDGELYDISVTTTYEIISSGYNYLEFGKWEHTADFGPDNMYSFVNHSWWLHGLATPETAIASQTGSYTYSGEAHGTMAQFGEDGSLTTARMDGSFTSSVNFNTASVQNFTMDVAGGGYSAGISGAGGSIGADGTFSLSGGTWSIQGLSPDHKDAYGRFFGPKAEEMGGNWAMQGSESSIEYSAVGIFGGKR